MRPLLMGDVLFSEQVDDKIYNPTAALGEQAHL